MKMRYLLGLFVVGSMLVACAPTVTNETIQTQLATENQTIENYRLTLQQTETRKGDNPTVTQVIANASVWNDGRGFGTRIDKTDGKATNEMEVVADSNSGAIRYYQDAWQSTLTAQSSLESVVGFPYMNVLNFVSTINRVVQWESTGILLYSGQDVTVRQALSQLGISVSEGVQVDVAVTLNSARNRIETFTLKTTDTDATLTREYRVNYSGFNTQQMRAVPVIQTPRRSSNS